MSDEEKFQDVLGYIDELSNQELISLKNQIMKDIDFLKQINNDSQLNFEIERLKRICKVLKDRNVDYKKGNTI